MTIPTPPTATRYTRPRLAKHIMIRPAIIQKLREALHYPLTIVRAGAGYGKTTSINQAFPEAFVQTVWLPLSEQDNVGLTFFNHLALALENALPSSAKNAQALLAWDGRQGNPDREAMISAFIQDFALLPAPTAIIFDDFQYVSDSPEVRQITDALLALLPAQIHIVIASREKVNLQGIALKLAKEEALEITEDELAFSAAEIAQLLESSHNISLPDEIAARLAERTEGWIMAIQMLCQTIKKDGSWETALTVLPRTLTELFEFLAQNFLAKQPAPIRNFLFATAHLDIMNPELCDHLLGDHNSHTVLRDLEQKGLFTFRIGDRLYRYHHLFQEFLRKNGAVSASYLQRLHYNAACWYLAAGDPQAINHYLAGGYPHEAANVLRQYLPAGLAAGQLAQVTRWLNALPSQLVNSIPELLLGRGDIFRITGDFPNALRLYGMAQKAFAAKDDPAGQYATAKSFALVYLDTVQPVVAEKYLTAAQALAATVDVLEQARLYRLIAENKTNLGRFEEAAAFFAQSNELFLEESRGDVEARMHLRTGRLLGAKQILLRPQERPPMLQAPKSHRETPLLLSLINAFMGDIDEAWRNAQEGLHTAYKTQAAFVEAVGYMRLGHAKQLKSWLNAEEAVDCYQQALQIVTALDVERGKAEPLFGLCLLYGHQGNVDSAIRYGLEGVRVSQEARDDWMKALNELAMTVAYYKAAQLEKAAEWGSQSYSSFTNCGDNYLSTVSLLWQSLILLDLGDASKFYHAADKLLFASHAYDYDFIFCKPTLLALRDPQGAIPLLLAAQKKGIRPEYVGSLLTELGANQAIVSHPGYTLRVQGFGPFKIWRGMQEVKPREWQREKAKRLFQYFITNRQRLVHKEQIMESIWGENGADSDFKVAMNAMTNVLEPNRHARKTPLYIAKNESAYGLNLAAGIAIDADEFESYINRGRRIEKKDPEQAIRLYRMALTLYKGDFMQECCYEDWCAEERERLLLLYLTTAERVAYLLFDRGETEECISLCNRILTKDRCWEAAYALLIRCYALQNNRVMAAKTFRHCEEALQTDLGVAPSDGTITLYEKIKNIGSFCN